MKHWLTFGVGAWRDRAKKSWSIIPALTADAFSWVCRSWFGVRYPVKRIIGPMRIPSVECYSEFNYLYKILSYRCKLNLCRYFMCYSHEYSWIILIVYSNINSKLTVNRSFSWYEWKRDDLGKWWGGSLLKMCWIKSPRMVS